jgi:hypothetical protein
MGARKKPSGGHKGRTGRGTSAGRRTGPPSVAPLAFDPFTPGSEHPEWVRKDFPGYVESRHEELARSVRTFESRGHTLTITTTYEVKVDGRLVTLHMMVDEQGQLWSHLCPYQSFASATELVRHLLERLPHLFEEAQPLHPSHGQAGAPMGHGGHDSYSEPEPGGAR